MYCQGCGHKSDENVRFCAMCGRDISRSGKDGKSNAGNIPQRKPHAIKYTDIVGFLALFVIGIVGVYLHPTLEVGIIAYLAVGASAVWVYKDSNNFSMNKWPWALATLVIWIAAFPVYLWKTRRIKGIATGLLVIGLVIGSQFASQLYPASKHFRRGLLFMNRLQLDRAEEEFKTAIKKNADLGEAHLNLGVLYMEQGLMDAAEERFLEAKTVFEKEQPTIATNSQKEALALSMTNLAVIYTIRANEAMQILDRHQAQKHHNKALDYANNAQKLDNTNLRSAEIIRRLKNMASFYE
ncbi:hypothetical protein ACFL6Y_00045 [Elusimicrobiota bacterium]